MMRTDLPAPVGFDGELSRTDVPFEWDAALENVGGDEAMLRELAEMFFAECPKLMQQIREHIAGEDGTELRRAAHTLKGIGARFRSRGGGRGCASVGENRARGSVCRRGGSA